MAWCRYSHLHNTWERAGFLRECKGAKKFRNYVAWLREDRAARQSMSAEEIEQADVARETLRDQLREWCAVERVVARLDRAPPLSPLYLCKWRELSYGECTWEKEEDIAEFRAEIDAFEARRAAQQQQQPSPSPPPPRKEGGERARPAFEKLTQQPAFLRGGQLRDYQLEGLNWLLYSWCTGTNGILADEMGLGKTLQTIALLGHLRLELGQPGPFLVVVPLSTITNWAKEFAKWAPQLNVVMYTGNSRARAVIRQYEFYGSQVLQEGQPQQEQQQQQLQQEQQELRPTASSEGANGVRAPAFDVLLTTYELILKDRAFLGPMRWTYLAVDEAHRLKNTASALHDALKDFHTESRLLITGTPLQNSLKELWSLLHFLQPGKFHSLTDFERQYADLRQEEQIARLHAELKPHILRRVKKDVEKSLPAKIERILRVDMAPLQRQYYRWILTRNFRQLNKPGSGSQVTLLNIMMELKKTCNHPFLFDGAREEAEKLDARLGLPPGQSAAEDPAAFLIRHASKMQLLDKLLVRLKETGHRVLIFSQMVRMLDLLATYLKLRGFAFQRLDGSMSRDRRQAAMDAFNAPGSPDFVFLLSTRAGGLGINLSTADTVIIFDSDWNPQNDLQAEARAHRIGQKNVVNIYRLVTAGTIEEDILSRAKKKMVLDHLVIQRMDRHGGGAGGAGTASASSAGGAGAAAVFSKEELAAILKFGAADLFKEPADAPRLAEVDLDEILARAEHRDADEEQQQGLGSELLNSFKVANFVQHPDAERSWSEIIPEEALRGVEQAPVRRKVRSFRPYVCRRLPVRLLPRSILSLFVSPLRSRPSPFLVLPACGAHS